MPLSLSLAGVALLSLTVTTTDDENAILKDVGDFLQTTDAEQRVRLVERIRANPAYDARNVSQYLHRGKSYGELKPGRRTIPVTPPGEPAIQLTLRVPKAYSPTAKYPLVYSLHCGGCDAESALQFAERLLGSDVEEFIVAVPFKHYGVPDFLPYQTPTALRAIKRVAHIDSDRVYVTGYSAGACAAWALALLQPDEFAAVIPVAGSLYIGEQTYDFLPNIANTHVLSVWGALDNGHGWEGDKAKGMADSNRQLQAELAKLRLPVDLHEYPNKGHFDIEPPQRMLAHALVQRRAHYPALVNHHFQHAVQARAYWLERNVLEGERWPRIPAKIDQRPGEHENDAIARALAGQQGELHGEIAGQTITVTTKNADSVTVWIGEGTIDWKKPVRLALNGNVVFDDVLEPDLFVCLAQAARTLDFDRLRWSGLMVSGSGPAERVTGRTVFLPPAP